MRKELTPHHTVALIVDLQERLMPAMHDGKTCIERSQILLKGLQALEIPLLLTEQYPKGLGATIAEIKSLLPEQYPYFEKTQFSALIPAVQAELEQRRATNVILLGAETHVCMLQSVLDLQMAGFQTYIPFECTASRLQANKDNALIQMRDTGAIVSNVESILFQLLKNAQHPAFKTISQLII